jgi:hypothetical protein
MMAVGNALDGSRLDAALRLEESKVRPGQRAQKRRMELALFPPRGDNVKVKVQRNTRM